MAAKSIEGRSAKWMLVHDKPDIHQTKIPVIAVVSKTPTVLRTIPGARIGFISLMRVPNPPANRMIDRDTIPTNWAPRTSSNCTPRPSQPKIMPTTRNSKRAGIPNRYPGFCINMPAISNTAPMSRMLPVVKVISY